MPASNASISSCMPQLANVYRASGRVEIDEDFLLGAAAAVLKTDAQFSAAIALVLSHRARQRVLRRGSVFRARAWWSIPRHPPKVGDSLEETAKILRSKTFAEYFTRVFAPYYLETPAECHGRFADRAKPARCHRRSAAHGSRLLLLDQQRRSDPRSGGARLAEENVGHAHRGLRSWRASRQSRRSAASGRHARHAGGRWPGSR